MFTSRYGDYTPQSSGGRPFFVVWSLFAVPSITILIGAMSNTVVDSFNKGTNKIADFTLLPKHGIWRDFIASHPKLLGWAVARQERIEAEDRVEDGFPVGPGEDEDENRVFKPKTIEELATENPNRENRSELGRRLAHAIKQVTQDIKNEPQKRYSYEEWAEWSILIRFTGHMQAAIRHEIELHQLDEPEVKGLLEWDWLGEDSPMMSDSSEPEWLLDRLIESMTRYTRNIMAFLRLEKERGVVMDGGVISPSGSESRGNSPVQTRSRTDGWKPPRDDDALPPDQRSDEESYEETEETKVNDGSETQRDQDREDEIGKEMEKEEKKWDEDDERRAEQNGNRTRPQESRHNGLPGLLGELDDAWRAGRRLRR